MVDTNSQNIGIIGCGNISEAYLTLAPQYRDLTISAVSDKNINAAKERASQFGIAAKSVDDLLADSSIGLIINLTVPDAHFDVSRQALQAGKHVYSEKPFVLSLQQAEELKQLSESKDLRIGSAPDTFLGGAHQQARQLIDDGAIGRIVAGTVHVMGHGMEDWHPNPDFFFQPGAGPVLDIGPYYLTNLVQLIGPIHRVAALSSSASTTRTITSEERHGEIIKVNTPTNIHALLEFKQGATITLSASWDVWAHKHRNMELYGTEGSLVLPDPNFFGGQLEIAGREGEFSPVPIAEHAFGRPNEIHDHVGWVANYRAAGLADMMQAINKDTEHRCSLELATHIIEAMTAILQAGETGQYVTLETSCEQPAPLVDDDARNLLREPH